ncbi:MAG TPA: LEPR-XLL domain-containing protein [Tepidisphaeraceae bacterium]|nr:LEPR-XLL domain-containing protein [Tepidisphaeraceae bacterium]
MLSSDHASWPAPFEPLEQRILLSAAVQFSVAPPVVVNLPPGFVIPQTPVTLPLGIAATGEGAPIQAAAGQVFDGEVGFFPGEISADPTTLELSIDWGDGTTTGGTLQTVTLANGQTAVGVFGSHIYSQPGFFKVVAHANEDVGLGYDGTFGTTEAIAEVSGAGGEAGSVFAATDGQDYAGSIGEYSAPNGLPAGAQATIDWGDGSTFPGQIIPESDGDYEIIGAHTFGLPNNGPCVDNVLGISASISTPSQTLATIRSIAVVSELQITGSVISAESGTEFSGALGQFDASLWVDSPLYTSNDFLAATIDWGDGVVTSGQIDRLSSGAFAITGTHTYGQNGYFVAQASVWEMEPVAGQSFPAHVYVPAIIYSAFNVQSPPAASATVPVNNANRPVFTPNFSSVQISTDNWLGDNTNLLGLLEK